MTDDWAKARAEWREITCDADLPPEGKYVIARHNRGTWHDRDDQDNVSTVVVKFVRGLSAEERATLKGSPRGRTYRACDEGHNNQRPYCWQAFGPGTFFGQEITHWMPIPPLGTQ